MRTKALSDKELAERDLEAYARRNIREAGGWMYKWVSPGVAGVPDDIIIWPHFPADHFAEFKSQNGLLSAPQLYQLEKLQSLGRKVFVFSNRLQVDQYIDRFRPVHDIERDVQSEALPGRRGNLPGAGCSGQPVLASRKR